MKTRTVERGGRLGLAGLTLGLLAACIVFVLIPAQRATSRIEAFGGAIDMLSTTEASLTSLDEEVERLKLELEEAENLLPAGVGVDEFVDRVGAAAEAADVRVESVIPGEVIEEPRYRKLNLELRAAGSYPALHRFLGAVENLPQLTRVETVKIAGDESTCTANIVLALYYARPGREG